MSWNGPLCIPLVWDSLCFLDLHVHFLYQIREVFFHYFLQIGFQFPVLSSLSGAPMKWLLEHLKMFHRLFILLSLFEFFFLVVVLIGCFLLPYVPSHWFDSWLHRLYYCFPVNWSLFLLVYPLFLTGYFLFYFFKFTYLFIFKRKKQTKYFLFYWGPH